jgi:hypothetical protein
MPEQPTLVFLPLFRYWHKIKCHICPSHCSFQGMADFGKAWGHKQNFQKRASNRWGTNLEFFKELKLSTY